VLTAIYGLGAAFAQIASKVMEGVAALRSGLASVTFGGLSESFRLAAADAEEMAGAFAASADALKAKAAESLQRMADGAQTARDAWDGLTGKWLRSAMLQQRQPLPSRRSLQASRPRARLQPKQPKTLLPRPRPTALQPRT
jgi:hypothetical protein